MSEHNLILEFYKPTYNLDFDYDGDGGLDLHFTNIKGEFFMTMNDSYNSVYIEDEDCEFSKGEMFATVDLGDLVERIINGEFRQTNGKAFSDWGKRFIGDGEEPIEFNGKNYADGSLFWDDFFKEMSKDEIKDFMTFCEDYLDLPNIEVDTVSDKYDFENGKVELKSNGKWGITVNDDYTIISVDKFTCNSTDACNAYDIASSESDGDDYYESKKSAKKSLKEKMDSKSEEIYYLLYRLFELNLIQTNDYDEDRFDEITDYIEKNGVDKSYKNEAYKLAMQYINHDFSNGKEYKELIKKFLDLFDLQVNVHSVEWNVISESKKSVRKSLKEGISAFNKAIAKKYNETEPNSVGQYYLDWRFDLQDEKDNIEAIADRCGVTVEFQSDEGYFEVFEESKKSVKRSLKEEKVTDSLFQNIVFSMIKKFKLKKEYDVERPSWSVFNFRHKNKDAQFAITFDERGHGDFLYGEVLAFGDEKDDIFKYKTDEVKVDSYNIEKECSNIIADCLAFIDANKKITIFESEKSARKSLKEGINDELIATSSDGETTLYLSYERQANHGKDPHYEFKLGENGYFTTYIRCDDNRCEDVVLDWIKEFDLDISKSEISRIIKLHESKKSARKSLKENELFSSNTPYEIKVNGKKIKSHSDYEVVYDRVENDEYVLGIKIKGVGNAQLRFSSKNEAKELGWIINESEKSTKKSLKKYLVKGLDVDFVVDHLLSLEDPNNFDLINKLDDLWELYKKSWNKFSKSLSDLWKVMKDIEKLDSFDKTCMEIVDAWYDDIEKIFYSDDSFENLKLNYGFEGNDLF